MAHNRTILLSLWLVLPSVSITQNTFPLQVGNKWQYWMTGYQNGQYFYTYGWTVWVDRDTLFPNGKTYAVLVSDGQHGGILRQDGLRVVTPSTSDTERVNYDFSKTVGDTIGSFLLPIDTLYTYIIADDLVLCFGQSKRRQIYYTKRIRSSEGVQEHIVDGFGVARYEYEPGEIWDIRGAIINGVTYGVITSVPHSQDEPFAYSLDQNFPNPFNPSTTISFSLPKSERVSIQISDLLGRTIDVITNQDYSAGRYYVVWHAPKNASGVYVYTIQAGRFHQSRKLIVLR